MSAAFRTEVFGKCILAGEHAVLRGCPALVFPLRAHSLILSYQEGEMPLTAHFHGPRGDEVRLLFWSVWERALELCGHAHSEVLGSIDMDCSLPVGAGMGASGSLCVAVGQWFEWRGWVKSTNTYEFCRELEDLFHGESSGVDIAVALENKPLYFERGKPYQVLSTQWQPQWYLSYSGKRGVTSECVAKVKNWIAAHPEEGLTTDRMMRESVEACRLALQDNRESSLATLIKAVDQARLCFERWGLTDGEIGQHMQMLMDHGAAAVKPTGSGNGGYVLSLWALSPPPSLLQELIALEL